jgi:hypothetical protein
MESRRSRFHVDEYVVLTQPYRGIPAGSVGAIVTISFTRPARYCVSFGPSLVRSRIPEDHLTSLRTLRHRKRV